MTINHPYDPRFNAKLHIPKLTEEERRARATPLENLKGLRFRTEMLAAPSPAEVALPTSMPTPIAPATPPQSKAAVVSTTHIPEHGVVGTPCMDGDSDGEPQVTGDRTSHTIARNEHSCARCARNERVQRHCGERLYPESRAVEGEQFLAGISP